MKNVIIGENIKKVYGYGDSAFTALHGIDLTVNEGDFIGIMGPSGSGKSTFLNVISTIDTTTSGKVIINGQNVKAMNEGDIARFRYENIGFIFQDFNLIDELTIEENIAIPLIASNVPKKEIEEKVLSIAKKLNIDEFLHKYPCNCSGGQKQRAATARALVNNPKLIIADEPTGNLDTKNSHDLLTMLKDMNDNENKTIIMVTHDSMIASYTKKLLFIRDGKIDEILEKGNLSQRDFFYNIVDITSKESQALFEVMGK